VPPDFFLELPTDARAVILFGMVRQLEDVCISRVQSHAISYGDGVPECHKNLVPFTCTYTV